MPYCKGYLLFEDDQNRKEHKAKKASICDAIDKKPGFNIERFPSFRVSNQTG
jgi:hypothetical protein